MTLNLAEARANVTAIKVLYSYSTKLAMTLMALFYSPVVLNSNIANGKAENEPCLAF